MENGPSEQLKLPMDVREKREVYWFTVEQETKKRWLGLGKKVVTKLVSDGTPLGITHKIDSDDIPKVKDPTLRAYLQLADAANAMGFIKDNPESPYSGSYGHSVHIEATDEGFDSKFVSGYVHGTDQSKFWSDLHTFAPKHEDN